VETIGKTLLIAAVVIAVLGVLLIAASKLGWSRLPGDIVIRRDGLTIYIPLGLMVLLSVLGSLVLWLVRKL
jgi:hypothetical protein